MLRKIIIQLLFFFIGGIIYSQNLNNIPTTINSAEYKTVAPYISYDGKKIVFISETEYSRKLMESKFNPDGTWSNPVSVEAVNNFDSVSYYIDAPVYNHDASELYFSLKYEGKSTNYDIYNVKKIDGVWSKPEKMSNIINSKIDETDPFLSPDGKYLYFARKFENDKLKKFECYKIFVSERTANGWKKPIPLPEPVNEGCDKAPRIAADGKTLYFSSVRNNGETGSDIYYAKKITKNAWMSPVAIDTINTPEDESYPSVPSSGNTLYFQSGKGKGKNRTESFISGNVDFQFQPEKTVHIYGFITDLKNNKPLAAKINIVDPNTSIILFKSKTNEQTGAYSFFLQKGKKYRIDVYNEDYSHYFFNYSTQGLSEYSEEQKNIKLYSEINLVLNVYDAEIYEPLSANVQVVDVETQEKKKFTIKKNNTGRFYITLPIGKQYSIQAEKAHFEKNNFELDLRGVVQFSEFERDLELQVRKIDYEIALADSETGEGVETFVEITNLSTNEKIIKKVKTDKDGKLKIKLRDGTRYEISVTPKGYAFYNVTVDLVDENAAHTLDAKLDPLKKATKIELNDINFESNSADLNKSSFEELERVVKLLKINNQIKIEISAHTDDVGSKPYNLKLSDRRARSVKEYLFSNDIEKEQIVSKGYGESKPAYLPFNTDENRAKNRRVQLEVIEINQEQEDVKN